eukprot:c25982_g1_i2 orf=254-2119(+)
MALVLPSPIGSIQSSFCGSANELNKDASKTGSFPCFDRTEICQVRCIFQSKLPADVSQALHRHPTSSDFPLVSRNTPPRTSLCTPAPEKWWKRSSHPQSKPYASPPQELVTQNAFPSASANDAQHDCCSSPTSVLEKEHSSLETNTSVSASGGVPVYVMLPLDSVTFNNTVNRRRALNASLLALKSAGVAGVMMDVWWGLVERDEPGKYTWSGYKELMDIIKSHGLKIQAVMSFHQCGGNVGDSCFIPLPKWVVEETNRNPDLAYTDKQGRRNYEYLSLGCDTLPVLKGKTPVQAYADYMRSFRDTFRDLLGETIVEIQVGMGPAGELRYPSYPESNGTWRFPGIGEFQCYDKYMLASLRAAAAATGNSEWGHGGPGDAGHYNNFPDETNFFRREGGWTSAYGEFFLEWYSGKLLAHGELILTAAESIFRNTGANLSGKVAGIHWHYGSRSHASELTAGYYNTRLRDGYLPIARMFGRHGIILNFTCIEMQDDEQPPEARCSPENLIRQVVLAARKARIPVAGENALPRYDERAMKQIVKNAKLRDQKDAANADFAPMCAFTFLRLNQVLFRSDNWRLFVPFVRKMGEGRSFNGWEEEQRASELFVGAARPLGEEAEAALA